MQTRALAAGAIWLCVGNAHMMLKDPPQFRGANNPHNDYHIMLDLSSCRFNLSRGNPSRLARAKSTTATSTPTHDLLRDSQGQFKKTPKKKSNTNIAQHKEPVARPDSQPTRFSVQLEKEKAEREAAEEKAKEKRNLYQLTYNTKSLKLGDQSEQFTKISGRACREKPKPYVPVKAKALEFKARDAKIAADVKHQKDKKEDRTLERNIDKVILGDIKFDTWYPSWYPKEIIGEKALSLAEEGKGTGIVVDKLYVCSCCFKYSKKFGPYVKHWELCKKKGPNIPGKEIYVQLRGQGLGAKLMGVSYEIARRAGIMGRPEKPISNLGKKGYKRYWSAEICRWFLMQKDYNKKNKGLWTIEGISQATWIAPEDVLATLREMNLAQKESKSRDGQERCSIDKNNDGEYVEKMKLNLIRVVDLNRFIEGYAEKKKSEEVEE
ncbi:acyl-CoA N-acyltransferase [Acephala macrosclerotiorum]|nr:acyl-CoA N-acyltransferase [Acephala macrosclerotiorum]